MYLIFFDRKDRSGYQVLIPDEMSVRMEHSRYVGPARFQYESAHRFASQWASRAWVTALQHIGCSSAMPRIPKAQEEM